MSLNTSRELCMGRKGKKDFFKKTGIVLKAHSEREDETDRESLWHH